MPGDPKLCRQYAVECAELAGRAANPDHKRLLTNLSQTWLSLAVELERSHALLDAYPPEAMGERPSEAMDERS